MRIHFYLVFVQTHAIHHFFSAGAAAFALLATAAADAEANLFLAEVPPALDEVLPRALVFPAPRAEAPPALDPGFGFGCASIGYQLPLASLI